MAMEKILVVNCGSSSKKYALFSKGREICSLYVEKERDTINYTRSIELFLNQVKKQKVSTIDAIGFRIVAPSTYFTQHRKITAAYLKKLKDVCSSAPLHIEPTIEEIEQWQKLFPNVSFFGISDSAFHTTLPAVANKYALQPKITNKYDLYRFGYHGISLAAIVRQLTTDYKKVPEKCIVCHLSGGSSITALKHGKSIDTSMGFTPLEGVPMESRVGTIDAAAILYVLNTGISQKELQKILFNSSGIFGLSGQTDMRKIVHLAQQGNKSCLAALDYYAYAVAKYIGSYYVALEGLDTLVFTGGMGEGAPLIRSLVTEKLHALSIKLDKNKNSRTIDASAVISQNNSAIQVIVLPTDEMYEMAIIIKKLMS